MELVQFKGIVWFKHLFSEISVENIDMDFLADLAFFGSKLIIKILKMAKSLCKVVPQGRNKRGVLFRQIFDKSLTRVNIAILL